MLDMMCNTAPPSDLKLHDTPSDDHGMGLSARAICVNLISIYKDNQNNDLVSVDMMSIVVYCIDIGFVDNKMGSYNNCI